jgi:hypothetical protein
MPRHVSGSDEQNYLLILKATTLPILWRDLISQPIAPVSLVAGGVDTTRPRHQGMRKKILVRIFGTKKTNEAKVALLYCTL